DLVFGIGCSFTRSSFATPMPKGMRIAHSTLDPTDINKDVPVEFVAVGDAGLTLDALLEEVKDRGHGKPRGRLDGVTRGISSLKKELMVQWMPRLTQNNTPLSPYSVIWELLQTVDGQWAISTY